MKDYTESKMSEGIREKIEEIASAMGEDEARVFASALPWDVLVDEIKTRYSKMESQINAIENAIKRM